MRGVLCASCKGSRSDATIPRYTPSDAGCTACSEVNLVDVFWPWVAALVAGLVLAVAWVRKGRFSWDHVSVSLFKGRRVDVVAPIKILLSFWQILTLQPSIFATRLPPSYLRVLKAVAFSNFQFPFAELSCMFWTNHDDRMRMVAASSLLVIAVLVLQLTCSALLGRLFFRNFRRKLLTGIR
jgi:hypothetical protein